MNAIKKVVLFILAAGTTSLFAQIPVPTPGGGGGSYNPAAVAITGGTINGITSFSTVSDGVHPSDSSGVGNTTAPAITANTWHLTWPNATTFTGYGWQIPTANPAANQVVAIGAPDGTTHEAAISYISNSTTVGGVACALGSTCSPPGTVMAQPAPTTGLTANVATTTLYTPATTGYYMVCAEVAITTAATTSSALPYVLFSYTSPVDSQTKFLQPPGMSTLSYNSNSTANNGCGLIYAKAATAIQYSTSGYASSGTTAMQYFVALTAVLE
jgi:hypothetical protein